jgi:hypothetical protein
VLSERVFLTLSLHHWRRYCPTTHEIHCSLTLQELIQGGAIVNGVWTDTQIAFLSYSLSSFDKGGICRWKLAIPEAV